MSRTFNPIRLLKELSNELLCELFVYHDETLQIPWHNLSLHEIEPIMRLWESITDAQRHKMQVVLHEVHTLADDDGLRVLAEELAWRCPHLVAEFDRWRDRRDQILRAWLYAREAFEEAAIFAQADTLATSRYWTRWQGPAVEDLTITEEHTKKLQKELRGYYWPNQMLGRHCHIHHYPLRSFTHSIQSPSARPSSRLFSR